MKAQWLDHELDRIPYFDLTGKSFIPKSDKTLKVKKNSTADGGALTHQQILETKWEKEKEDKFQEF
mgnify:CR=1 FL=1